MSTAGQNAHQLQLDIQHELITANQLLNLISTEVKSIKNFTSTGGQLDILVKQSAASISALAHIHEVDLENIPPVTRLVDIDQTLTNFNQTNQEQSTLRNESEMDDDQIKLVY